MKRQIDPNLDNESNDLLNELSSQIDKSANNNLGNSSKPVDPQLNIDVNSVLSNNLSEDEKNIKNDFSVDNKNNPNESHHHSEHHHHDEHYHSEHHHSEHHYDEHYHSEHHHSEHHHSHHHEYEEKEKKKKKKFLPILFRILLAIIAIILVIAIIASSTFFYLKMKGEDDIKSAQKIVTEDNEYNETIQYNGKNYVYDSDVITFAFLGIDQQEFNTGENTNYVGSADTDIVIAINTKDGKVDVIAIPRDTMVDIDIYNKDNQFLHSENRQLCLAYRFGNGGEQSSTNVVKSMSRILEVPIEKYFTLDLNGIGPLNDAVGGITLESKFDFKHDYGLDIQVGDEVNLKGDMAQLYVRARGDDNLNASLGRTERQIQYIKAYMERLLPAVKEDFGTISKLYDTASEYSQTNITLENLTYIASILLSKNITEFETHTLSGKMQPQPVETREEDIYAQYILDEQKKTELVLDVFYDEVG